MFPVTPPPPTPPNPPAPPPPGPPPRRSKYPSVIAFIWGFAEATVFFIIPDVWLTAVTLKADRRQTGEAFGWCLAGAILGGILVYGTARAHVQYLRDCSTTTGNISSASLVMERVNRL